MTTTDADRLAAEGQPLSLADGRTVHVKYTLRSLRAIEKRWGSLRAVDTLIPTDDEGQPVGEIIDPLTELLACGLLHEGISADDLLDLIHPAQIQAAFEVAAVALAEGMPAPTQQEEGEPTGGPLPQTANGKTSRGRRSSTSRRSPVASPPKGSGG